MKIKKYLIPLIFILLLTFTLIGNCAWLSGYDHRIALTIDHSKIDSDLSDFPVTVFFTSTQGEEIFTEFDADSDYMKCAFTSSDGITQLYAEKELFDISEQKAIYHVKVPTVSSSTDTVIYYYYDDDHADNTTYIGAIGTTAGENVWDSNFKAVYHMADNTTSTILDSTSNNNDGTKKAANEPIETTGKVGQAQDFDGSDDYIDIDTVNTDIDVDSGTISVVVKRSFLNTVESNQVVYSSRVDANNNIAIFYNYVDDTWQIKYKAGGITTAVIASADDIPKDTWTLVTLKWNTATDSVKAYINGTQYGSTLDNLGTWAGDISVSNIGASEDPAKNFIDASIDEVQISTVRSAAWIEATYNTLWDSLLTYGSEEIEEEEEANSIFFGCNF